MLLLPYCARNRRVIHKLDGSEQLDDREKTETTQVATSRDSVRPSTRYITYYTLLESRGPGKGREGGRPTVLPSTNRRIDVYTTQPYTTTTQPLLGRLTFSSQTWALFSFLYFFSFFYHHHHHTHTTVCVGKSEQISLLEIISRFLSILDILGKSGFVLFLFFRANQSPAPKEPTHEKFVSTSKRALYQQWLGGNISISNSKNLSCCSSSSQLAHPVVT